MLWSTVIFKKIRICRLYSRQVLKSKVDARAKWVKFVQEKYLMVVSVLQLYISSPAYQVGEPMQNHSTPSQSPFSLIVTPSNEFIFYTSTLITHVYLNVDTNGSYL